jgi:hypothetical protein
MEHWPAAAFCGAVAIFGGSAPFAATWLIENPIADCAGFSVIVAALLSLSAILTLR